MLLKMVYVEVEEIFLSYESAKFRSWAYFVNI